MPPGKESRQVSSLIILLTPDSPVEKTVTISQKNEGVGQVAQTINGQKIQYSGQRHSENKQASFPASCLHNLPFFHLEALLPDIEKFIMAVEDRQAHSSKQQIMKLW